MTSRISAYALTGGIVAGTLDILFAWAFWQLKAGVAMQRILQSVGAGLLGPDSFAGGARTAALGLALHYFIAIAMSFAFCLAALRWSFLTDRPITAGAVYGLGLYAFMNLLVVPLSSAGAQPRDPLWVGLSVAAHVVLIGIPIALAAHRAVRPRGHTVQRP